MNAWGKTPPHRRKPPEKPVENQQDDLFLADLELRENPRKRRLKPDDLTLGEIQEVSERMEKLRKHFRADIDEEIRKRLRELLRKNPDATIEDYLDGDAEGQPEDGEGRDDE